MKKIFFLSVIILAAVSAGAQWQTDSVSTPRANIPIAVIKNKLVMGSTSGNAWDVFDLNNGSHGWGNFSLSRTEIQFAQAGNNVYFGGGKYGYFADPQYTKNVDVYNASANTWSVLNLSLGRAVGGAGALGNKVFFAGGIGRQDISGPVYLYNRVDIFNATNGTRTNAKLSKARTNIAVGAAGNKILFAGGWFWDVSYNQVQTDVVDIYDNATATWSVAKLSNKREAISVAVIGSKILFAGGFNGLGMVFNTVDIYDASTNTWTATTMSTARYGMAVAVVGSKAYFAGGSGATNVMDIYDASTASWTHVSMPLNLTGFSATVVGDNIYFAGGYDPSTNAISDAVQVYNTVTGTWSSLVMSQPRYAVAAANVKGNAVFAGGYTSFGIYPLSSNRIDIYTPPVMAAATVADALKVDNGVSKVYPNPASDYLFVLLSKPFNNNVLVSVFDLSGKLMIKQQFQSGIDVLKLPVFSLPKGIYVYTITGVDQSITGKFMKQ